jgi:menaquinone-specific isochorismate synthase
VTSSVAAALSAPLVARTVRTDDPGPLLQALPRDRAVAWLRGTHGIVGWGEAARLETDGPSRFSDAQSWWSDLAARAVVRDEVRVPGSGLVAIGSFAYADHPGSSVLVVPSYILGRRGDLTWLTSVAPGAVPPPPARLAAEPFGTPPVAAFSDGALSGADWAGVVAQAVGRIRAGELEKVVLARDLVADLDGPLDIREPLARLAARYPTCWTFHIDGFFGATPELLVRRTRGLVMSRVLAGTIRRTGDDASDLALAATLALSLITSPSPRD